MLKNKSILGDYPICNIEDDCFEIEKYSNAIFQFIEKADTPTVLSIEGGWGEGKTSLLNLLNKEFEDKDKNFMHIKFNAWNFVFSDNMNASFLSVVLGTLLDKGELKTMINGDEVLSSATKTIFSFISKIGVSYIEKKTGVDITEINEDFNKFLENQIESSKKENIKTQFESIIKKIVEKKGENFKIIISLDDLDRIQPVKAIEIIEVIKNFLDVKGVIFLLVVDNEVVKKGLVDKFKLDIENEADKKLINLYFDKIIQLSFKLPKKDKIDYLIKYINNVFNLNLDEKTTEDKKKLEDISRLLGNATNNNPRTIKRVANIYTLKKIILELDNEKIDIKSINNELILSSLYSIDLSLKDKEDFKELLKEIHIDNNNLLKVEKETNVVTSGRDNDSFKNNDERLLYLIDKYKGSRKKDLMNYFQTEFNKQFDQTVFSNLESKTSNWISKLRIVEKGKGFRNGYFNSNKIEIGDIGPLIEKNNEGKYSLTDEGKEIFKNNIKIS